MLNVYSLTFSDPALEREFVEYTILKERKFIRWILWLGLTSFILSFILFLPEKIDTKEIVFLSILPIITLLFIAFTYSTFYVKYYYFALITFLIISLTSGYLDGRGTMFVATRFLFWTLIPFYTFPLLIFACFLSYGTIISVNFFANEEVFIKALFDSNFIIPFIVISLLIAYSKQYYQRLAFYELKQLKKEQEKVKSANSKLENKATLGLILKYAVEPNITLNTFLQKALDTILELSWLNIQTKGSIFITNSNGDLEMVASKDLGELTTKCATIKSGECLCGLALLKKELLFTNCITDEHTIQPKEMTPHGHYNIPLMLDDKVLGVLNVYVEHGHKKIQEEIDFFNLVSDALATAVHRFQLEEENVSQKEEIDKSYQKIKNSIDYAKRIQRSLLTAEKVIKINFKNCIAEFLPKEIVSGDFYLAIEKKNNYYIAVGDCTGHGVPGAMVSTLGILELTHIIENRNSLLVSQILDILNYRTNKLLNNDGEIGSDGMDLVLLNIDTATKTIQYAGAKGIFYIFRNGDLIKHKTDRASIGEKQKDKDFAFNLYQIKYEKGDVVYLLTDGLQDQISIGNKKRIGSKRVKELLTEMGNKSTEEKHQLFLKCKEEHIGDKQLDDITLISFEL